MFTELDTGWTSTVCNLHVLPRSGIADMARDDQFCPYMAQEARCTVLEDMYAYAPETTFLVRKTTPWTSRVGSSCGSRGGTPCASSRAVSTPAVTRALARRDGRPPALRRPFRAKRGPLDVEARGGALSGVKGSPTPVLALLFDAYVSGGADRRDPHVSPFFASPEGFSS